MAILIWKKQWSVGNLLIDSGHQNLIGMINSLEYVINNNDGPELLQMFKRFCDFAHLHFSDEEKILQAVEIPFIPHRLEHQSLLDELRASLNKLAADGSARSEYAMDHYPEFLRGWFVNHIKEGVATLKPVLAAHPYDFMPV